MNGYGINDLSLIWPLLLFYLMSPIIGYGIVQLRRIVVARLSAWIFAFGSVAFIAWITINEPYGTRMVLIVVALLWSMKAVVGVETYSDGSPHLPFKNWLAFTALWFGMRPRLFERLGQASLPDWSRHVRQGFVALISGIIFVLASRWTIAGHEIAAGGVRLWISTALLLPGLSLIVHFGLFNLLTGFWRWNGVNCSSLFRAPLRSRSLSEFWSKRWNLAFSEMTSIGVFRPLKRSLGGRSSSNTVSTIAAFAFSGLLHELAISLPVNAGYGLPLLYFAIHGLGIAIERAMEKNGVRLLNRPWAGSLWTAAWVLLPLPILFHRPFLQGCIWPLIGI